MLLPSRRFLPALTESYLQGSQRLLEGRYTPSRLHQAVVPQAHHPPALRGAADLLGRGPPQYHIPDLLRDHHELVDPGPSAVARLPAPVAADRLVEAQTFRSEL